MLQHKQAINKPRKMQWELESDFLSREYKCYLYDNNRMKGGMLTLEKTKEI